MEEREKMKQKEKQLTKDVEELRKKLNKKEAAERMETDDNGNKKEWSEQVEIEIGINEEERKEIEKEEDKQKQADDLRTLRNLYDKELVSG